VQRQVDRSRGLLPADRFLLRRYVPVKRATSWLGQRADGGDVIGKLVRHPDSLLKDRSIDETPLRF
jgi:hypothetical protein